MKIKLGNTVALIAGGLFILLRAMQYMFAMDKDGFFVVDSLMQMVLSYSLYACMVVFVIAALSVFFVKDNRYPAEVNIGRRRTVGFTAILYALTLAVLSVILFLQKDWLCALTLGAALYYILLAVRCDRSSVPMFNIMAMFALLYPCARIIRQFFATFKEIKASETVIAVLGQCAGIVTVIAITKLFMQFNEKMTKVSFCLMMGVSIGILAPVSSVLDMVYVSGFNVLSTAEAVADLVFWGLAVMLSIECAKYQPDPAKQSEIEEITGE
ncbi:MAG: hypothetical protein IKY33_00300 [Clostridia bacterium]|nr:hypothetical protein [Clostridia bacterium]